MAPKPDARWLSFSWLEGGRKFTELDPLNRVFVEEWCRCYAAPCFEDQFYVGLCLEHDDAPEIRIDLLKMIGAMNGIGFEPADYASAAQYFERCALLLRKAGEKKAAKRRGAKERES